MVTFCSKIKNLHWDILHFATLLPSCIILRHRWLSIEWKVCFLTSKNCFSVWALGQEIGLAHSAELGEKSLLEVTSNLNGFKGGITVSSLPLCSWIDISWVYLTIKTISNAKPSLDGFDFGELVCELGRLRQAWVWEGSSKIWASSSSLN